MNTLEEMELKEVLKNEPLKLRDKVRVTLYVESIVQDVDGDYIVARVNKEDICNTVRIPRDRIEEVIAGEFTNTKNS